MHPGSLYRLEVQAITEDGDGPTTSRTFQTPAHQSIPKHSENSIHIKMDFLFYVSLKHRLFTIISSVTQVIIIITISSSIKICFVFKIFIKCCCPLIQGQGWGSDTINSQSSRGSDCSRQSEWEHVESPHRADREIGMDFAIASGAMSGQLAGWSLKIQFLHLH